MWQTNARGTRAKANVKPWRPAQFVNLKNPLDGIRRLTSFYVCFRVDDRNTIILISDWMTDNGVRGAGFFHQELLRAEKVAF